MIAVNQTGYLKGCKKMAVYVDEARLDEGIGFQLMSDNQVVYEGTTRVMGDDKDSGDYVHQIDFSGFDDEGTYKLRIGDDESYSFAIGDKGLYRDMVRDVFNYYYQNRCSDDIDPERITSGDKNKLKRAAGHRPDIASTIAVWNYNGLMETLDVSGGWYDAGDHGKYSVNSGFSLWFLFNAYELESALYKKTGAKGIILDNCQMFLEECRWELDHLLRMLVSGGAYKDMAYSRVNDRKWTSIGTAPCDDDMERILMPPTTAATLDISASLAMAARIYAGSDEEYSRHLLDVSRRAYEAAKLHPNMLAPVDSRYGGGSYDDDDVRDEFYWAATELYITTGEEYYLKDMEINDYYLNIPFRFINSESPEVCGCFDWGNVAANGSLSLVLSDRLDDEQYSTLKYNVIMAASKLFDLAKKQGYNHPFGTEFLNGIKREGYAWGSNSYVCENATVLLYAYYITGDKQYIDVAVNGLNYILGCNPLNISYVTGYGSDAVKYPHHRFWAGQIREDRPVAPSGVMVGGPNSGMQCAYTKSLGWDYKTMPPAKMYVDHINAFSTNECTINWNGAFFNTLTGILNLI